MQALIAAASDLLASYLKNVRTVDDKPVSHPEEIPCVQRFTEALTAARAAIARLPQNEPAVPSNSNCLAGIACPQCGSLGPFLILCGITRHGRPCQVWMAVTDDGTDYIPDVTGTVRWDADSPCVCRGCQHSGSVFDFQRGDGLTVTDRARIDLLRRRGYAVAVFSPRELNGVSAEFLEDRVRESGAQEIADMRKRLETFFGTEVKP